ncbi:MAG: NUDIX hydrolase [Candidatus Microsaccharimonas sp.]
MEKRRINVRALIVRGDTILAVKHKNQDGSESQYWALPGGGLDPHETLQEGVEREVFEELGVQATSTDTVACIQQFLSSREDFDEELEFFMVIKDSPLFDSINLEETSHGYEELSRVAFVNPKEVFILPDFLSQINIPHYISGASAPYTYNELKK